MQAGVWYQKCYDPECRAYRSDAMPLPPRLVAQLPTKAGADGPKLQQSPTSPSRVRAGIHQPLDHPPAASQVHRPRDQPCTADAACCAANSAEEESAASKAEPYAQHAACPDVCQQQASNPTAAAQGAVQARRQRDQSGAGSCGPDQDCCWQQSQAGVFAERGNESEAKAVCGKGSAQDTIGLPEASSSMPWFLTC